MAKTTSWVSCHLAPLLAISAYVPCSPSGEVGEGEEPDLGSGGWFGGWWDGCEFRLSDMGGRKECLSSLIFNFHFRGM